MQGPSRHEGDDEFVDICQTRFTPSQAGMCIRASLIRKSILNHVGAGDQDPTIHCRNSDNGLAT